ncbi:hypothetical protein [Vibrio thalassae]|nr:hypothetical protein [Vibrio thalassae]
MEDIGDHYTSDTSLPVMTQLQTCLPRILPKLSDDDRHIIEMCDLNGLPQLDYAQKYGLTLAATKA